MREILTLECDEREQSNVRLFKRARDIIVTIECKIILKVYANIKIDERESKDARDALVRV